jgi:subtilisin family serine protease
VDKLLISRRGISETEESFRFDLESRGFQVERSTGGRLLVIPGDSEDSLSSSIEGLESAGYRVKLLPNTNILEVGSYRIDIEAATEEIDVPSNLEVPSDLANVWSHHLVQLTSIRTEESRHAIEEQDVKVVEPISSYGYFVVGSPQTVNSLTELEDVAWVGKFKPAYRISPQLRNMEALVDDEHPVIHLYLHVYPKTYIDEVDEVVKQFGGTIVREGSTRCEIGIVTIAIDARDADGTININTINRLVNRLVQLPHVRWAEYQSPAPTVECERSCLIVLGKLNDPISLTSELTPSYQECLETLGLSGAGVVIGICDTGVDTHDNSTLHKDLQNRLNLFIDTTGGITIKDKKGHGTLVAGIALGNAAIGDVDPEGFLLGQGIAPEARLISINPVDTPGGPGTKPIDEFTSQLVSQGVAVMNNSWQYSGERGYSATASLVDRLVRDPNTDNTVKDYLVIVFSAGNKGPNYGTITHPKEAKNVIVVGNSLNFRPGEGFEGEDIKAISAGSSRGPAQDGRILPTLVAPGTNIVSARSSIGGRSAYTDTDGITHNLYNIGNGTSYAAPHVSGVCALLIEWWRRQTDGSDPSPAMIKALLINGAEDLAGGPDGRGGTLSPVPNNDQGWGRVNLENIVLESTDFHRGPKIFFDQQHIFNDINQEFLTQIQPVHSDLPMRITLVWTDAPGAAGESPALVNDLDLEVIELATNNIYKGNVFRDGFSVTGGNFDNVNNIECVYILNPSGVYEVRVLPSVLSGNAFPPFDISPQQDFALVIDNAENFPNS